MKKLYLSVILAIYLSWGFGQNLIPNYDFENHISCDSLIGFYKEAPPWNTYQNTSFYFNACNTQTPSRGMPVNSTGLLGYQWARSGSGYMGFNVYHSLLSNVREYIQVKLKDTLNHGQLYCVEFYVNLANPSKYGTNRIGAYFSDTAIYCTPKCLLNYVPQVSNKRGTAIIDTLNWTKIEGSFTALGTEQYITIGNFYPDDSITKVQVNTQPYSTFYYIDDVSVRLCDSTIAVKELDAKNEIKVFPNPASDYVIIEIGDGIDSYFELKDNQGKSLLAMKLKKGQNRISTAGLRSGIYIYSISTPSRLNTGKLNIQK